ncbi:MAG: phosphoglycerate mutase family protein [Rubricoccaceae bacterium]|nr:phosphoglycerate mutase family protein [Rubricoccaceae bacterium]
MTSIYLVRHGDYDYRDAAPATVGQGLTTRGKGQAEATAKWLADADSGIRTIRSSDFTRAVETASILVDALPRAGLEIDPVFRECDDVYFKDTDRVPPSAMETFDTLCGPVVKHPNPMAGVCHANLIRYLLSRLLVWTRQEWESVHIGNCSVSIVKLQTEPEPGHHVLQVATLRHLPSQLLDNF